VHATTNTPLGFTFNYFQFACTGISIRQDGDVYLLNSTGQYALGGVHIGAYFITNGYTYPYYFRSETNATELYHLGAQIRSASFLYSTFAPANAFIITWFLQPSPSNPSLFNSFQLILATDGTFSYIVFNFEQLDQSTGSSFYVAPNSTVYNVNGASAVGLKSEHNYRVLRDSYASGATKLGRQVARVDGIAG
jgi:hypothetical protein